MTRALLASLLIGAALSGCGPGAECGFEPQCAGLTAYYRCKGPDVERVECPAQQFCAMDTTKKLPACTAGFTVSGLVTYAKRPQSTSGLGPPVQTPVPSASVSAVDDANNVMGVGFTDDDGNYTLAYQPNAGVNVHVLLATTANPATGIPLTVNGKGAIFGYGAPTFVSEPTHALDIAVTDLTLSEPLNVYTTAYHAFQYVKSLTTNALVPLSFVIYPNFKPSCGSCFSSSNNSIQLQFTDTDSDGFDDTVIDHEFGHYVQSRVSNSDSEGGPHDGRPADPKLAYGEGYASYFSSSARHNPMYMDTFNNGANGWWFNLRSNGSPANPALPMTQNISEWLVAETLWSIEDTQAPGLGKPATAIMDIMIGGVVRPGHVNRGVAGLDLVDFLDEWFIQRGTGDCAGLRTILRNKGFPYDYKPPPSTVSVCP